MSKTYVGISRDHSGSMRSIAQAAARDYNTLIQKIASASTQFAEDTIVSVVKCGVGSRGEVVRESVNSSVQVLKPVSTYTTDGGYTPLFDSVLELISILESAPDKNDPGVSFVINVITDGEENGSSSGAAERMRSKIEALQRTDRWTFTFRVPRGYARNLTKFGIPIGNILEWDQTERGMAEATRATDEAFTSYFSTKAATGKAATDKFYTNMADVDIKTVKKNLADISAEVSFWIVKNAAEGASIREFCEAKSGTSFLKGAAFYQLMKPEREVQSYKMIAIRDRNTGAIYSGKNARDLLGLPHVGTTSVTPGDHGQYEIYIQSTSINRKLPVGTTVLYWPAVGSAMGTSTTPKVKPATVAKKPAPKTATLRPAPAWPSTTSPNVPSTSKTVTPLGHSTLFVEGYRRGFEDGKRHGAVAVMSGDLGEGYNRGYKDGRGKKKRLYK